MNKQEWDTLSEGEKELRLQEAKIALTATMAEFSRVVKEHMDLVPIALLFPLLFEDMEEMLK